MSKIKHCSKLITLIVIYILTGALLFGCASKEKAADEEPKATLPDMSYITDGGIVVEGQIVKVEFSMDSIIYESEGRQLIVENSQQLKKVLPDPTREHFQVQWEQYDDSFFETHNLAISLFAGNSNEKVTYLSSIQFGSVVEQRYGYHDVAASGGAVEAVYVEYLFISEVTKDIDTIVLHEERYIAEVK